MSEKIRHANFRDGHQYQIPFKQSVGAIIPAIAAIGPDGFTTPKVAWAFCMHLANRTIFLFELQALPLWFRPIEFYVGKLHSIKHEQQIHVLPSLVHISILRRPLLAHDPDDSSAFSPVHPYRTGSSKQLQMDLYSCEACNGGGSVELGGRHNCYERYWYLSIGRPQSLLLAD